MITFNRLKHVVRYNPETGVFTWLNPTNTSVLVGSVLGGRHYSGYIRASIDGKSYAVHRLAWLYMTGEWPADQIDHINHIRDDNCWRNLREASNRENHMNRATSIRNTSGVTGVYWDKEAKKWLARIRVKGRLIHLGRFSDKNEAVAARKSAEVKYGYHENHGKARPLSSEAQAPLAQSES